MSLEICVDAAPAKVAHLQRAQAGRLQRISESTEALLPTVCAMALLPGGPTGLAYAPTALRHLMTSPDSPIADLYQDCRQCTALSQESGRLNTERTEVTTQRKSPLRSLSRCAIRQAVHGQSSVSEPCRSICADLILDCILAKRCGPGCACLPCLQHAG